MKHWIKPTIVALVLVSAAGCVVEERGPRGRTVVEERGHGHGHAYGHEKHGK